MRGTWLCQCSCGNKSRVDSYQLTAGIVQSCGCLRRSHPHRPDGRFIRAFQRKAPLDGGAEFWD
jgi:hypothetical protein